LFIHIDTLRYEEYNKGKHERGVCSLAQRITAYLRVSTEEQTKGFGLEEQREKLQAYCQFRGWTEVTWYEDPGYSGGNMDRPGLTALLEDVRAGKVDVVLTYKADRLSRKLKDLLVLIEDELEPRGVAFISATEDFNTGTASGKAFLSMLGTFAEFERNTIKERTLGGRKQKAARGGYAAGEPPLGYIAREKNLEIDHTQVSTVRLIFAKRAQGATLQQIADYLNAEGIPTKRNAKWHASTVKYILDNPKYRGVLQQTFEGQTIEKAAPQLRIA